MTTTEQHSKLVERAIRFNTLTEQQKLSSRASRFGVPQAGDAAASSKSEEQLRNRAERFGIASKPISRDTDIMKRQNRQTRFGTSANKAMNQPDGKLMKRAQRFGLKT